MPESAALLLHRHSRQTLAGEGSLSMFSRRCVEFLELASQLSLSGFQALDECSPGPQGEIATHVVPGAAPAFADPETNES